MAKVTKITYEEANNIAKTYFTHTSTNIKGVFFTRNDCEACKMMMEETIAECGFPSSVEIYEVEITDKNEIPFPPMRTPIAYFFVPNSPKMPIVREGVAPPEPVIEDVNKMISVMNGADYWSTFFGDIPMENLPEHEKK